MSDCYVYILASRHNGTLYVGVTSDLLYHSFEYFENKTSGDLKAHFTKVVRVVSDPDSKGRATIPAEAGIQKS